MPYSSVCSADIVEKQEMVGTDADHIQINEARFTGRWKYNRGCLLVGDKAPDTENENADVQNKRNHRTRIDGSWGFGLRQKNCR